MKCIFKRLRSVRLRPSCAGSAKLPVIPSGFDSYDVKPVSLGFKGRLRASNLDLQFSYSIRDGIFVNIKSVSPWKVLFEYADGSCLMNSTAQRYSELLAALKQLQETESKLDYPEVYTRLERIIWEHSDCLACAPRNQIQPH